MVRGQASFGRLHGDRNGSQGFRDGALPNSVESAVDSPVLSGLLAEVEASKGSALLACKGSTAAIGCMCAPHACNANWLNFFAAGKHTHVAKQLQDM